jgi:uncharacterized membrane protein YbhN (UPF0104 family)
MTDADLSDITPGFLSMKTSMKNWLHILGSLLGLFGVVFVVIQLAAYSDQIDLNEFSSRTWAQLSLLTVIYAMASTMLVKAWIQLLAYFGVAVDRRWALKAYGTAQIAKYVPGNIFHLAGRQALGMAAGLPGAKLAKSVFWELVLFACAGAFLGALAKALQITALPPYIQVATFCGLSLATIFILDRLLSPSLGKAFAWQFTFLIVSSFVFVGTLTIISDTSINFSLYLALCAGYITAWLAGLVTPGAPAGVGVRELVLLFFLKGLVNESDLLLAVVLGRVVTVAGDLLFFAYAYCARSRTESA